MPKDITAELIDENTGLLRQTLSFLGGLGDRAYTTCPEGLAPHRIGGHLRHVLEFYECFLAGLESGRVDYENRKREEAIEKCRHSAAARICSIVSRLEDTAALRSDGALEIRMENTHEEIYLASSIGRELQALSSHTIHHLALIAITLKMHGFEVDPDFGMSPSTLRYQATLVAGASRKAT